MEHHNITDLELERLEENINVVLPVFYKNILKNYPEKLRNKEDSKQFLIYDIRELIYNLVQHERWFNNQNTLPRNFFPIGWHHDGSPFFINLQNNDEKIYTIDHDDAGGFYDEETSTMDWNSAISVIEPNISSFVNWLENYLVI